MWWPFSRSAVIKSGAVTVSPPGCAKWWQANARGAAVVDSFPLTNSRIATLRRADAQVRAIDLPTEEAPGRDEWKFITPASPRGDCEDYVLTVMERLVASGFPRSRLRMAIVDRNGAHAVLAVRFDGADWISDWLDAGPRPRRDYGWRFKTMSGATLNPTTWTTAS